MDDEIQQTPSMEAHYFGPDETDIVVTKVSPRGIRTGNTQETSGERVAISISEGFSSMVESEEVTESTVLRWEEYEQLSEEEKQTAVNDSSIYVEPPKDWEQAIRRSVHVFCLPLDIGLGQPLWEQNKNTLWNIPTYHSHLLGKGERAELDDPINGEDVEFGQVYLSGRWAVVFAECRDGIVKIGLNRVQLGTVDLSQAKIGSEDYVEEMSFEERYKSEVWIPNIPAVESLRPEVFAFSSAVRSDNPRIDVCDRLELERAYDTGELSLLRYTLRKSWLELGSVIH